MELQCFDGKCNLSPNGERTKYIYNSKDKWIIGYYFDHFGKLLSDKCFVQMMDNLISGKKNVTGLFRYLGKIDAPDREVQNTLATGKYLEMYKKKAEKLPQVYEKKEEQMYELFNSKVKSLIDLIK